jgi:hypothetical protein
VNEYFAREQAYKSSINRIERAKKGYPSSSGRFPYGRIFDKKTVKWTIDQEKKGKIEEAARLYLEESISLTVLGKRFGINQAYLWQILTQRCGDTWAQRFQDKRFAIDETVVTKVPRLLPETIIQKIRAKCEARRVWAKGSPRINQYLFAHIIYDEESGYTLSGLTNHCRQQHYRSYKKIERRYMVNAKVLEDAVLQALFEALSENTAMMCAVFDGNPDSPMCEELERKKRIKEKELLQCKKRLSNAAKAIENFGGADIELFIENNLKESVKDSTQEYSRLTFEIQSIENQLSSVPTQEEINGKRELMSSHLKLLVSESYFNSGLAFRHLTFEAKRELVLLMFGGKDQNGKRYGIYIRPLWGTPRRYKFVAYGKLGDIHGCLESRNLTAFAQADIDWWLQKSTPKEVHRTVAKVIRDSDPKFYNEYDKNQVACGNYKARMFSKGSTIESLL